jgi:hypothetical protein
MATTGYTTYPTQPMTSPFTDIFESTESLATSDNFRFVCMVTSTCTYVCPYKGTILYEYTPSPTAPTTITVLSATTEPTSGTLALTAGKWYFSNGKPFDLNNITDNQQAVVPFVAIGSLFGFYVARNAPHTFYCYSPTTGGTVSYYYNTSITGTVSSTTTLTANTVTAITCNATAGGFVHMFVSTVPILASQTGTFNADHGSLYPMTPLQIAPVGGALFEENLGACTQSGGSNYSNTSGKRVGVTQIADGNGGNSSGSKDIALMRQNYMIAHSMDDIQFSFPYTNTSVRIQYYQNGNWGTYGVINGGTVSSTLSAVNYYIGSIAGIGYPPLVSTLPTVWLLTGSDNFMIRTNDPYDDEYTPLGFNDTTWRAFDGDNATYWDPGVSRYTASTGVYNSPPAFTTSGNSGDWIQLYSQQAINVKSYTILGRSGYETTRSPRNFWLMGSTNESTWTVIDTQTSITTWTSATPKTFIPAVNSGLYNYLRLVVGSIGNLTSGGSNQDIVQISTLSFTGSTGSIVFSGTGAITFS